MTYNKKQRNKAASKRQKLSALPDKRRVLTRKEEKTPLTLQKASTNLKDLEQAWRTVRSDQGYEIFIEIDVGTPSQTLNVLIDSGSDWFWVNTD